MCAGAVRGLGFPAGPLEEVELQVFPDTELDTEVRDAAGDGQVCSLCPELCGAAGAVAKEGSLAPLPSGWGPRTL